MKKTLLFVLAALLLLSLAACGKPVEEEPRVEIITPAPAEEVKEPETSAEQPEETAEPAAPAAEAPAFDEEKFSAAEALKGESVEDLFDAIGEPDSIEEYMSSCMGPGEDGLFHYPGFDVYTYREGDSEIVYEVLES